MKIVVASDHCGFELKAKLMPELKKKYEVVDLGCHSTEPVDFPDIAQQICKIILEMKGCAASCSVAPA